MFKIFKVKGNSMFPNFLDNDFVFITSFFKKLKEDDVIISKFNNDTIIKRINKIKDNRYYITGDNKEESSNSFGFVNKENILGKVLFKV